MDMHLAREYFENPTKWGTGIVWTYPQITAVMGHPDYADSVELTTLYDGLGEPESECAGVESSERFNAETNPGGVRCSLADYEINLWGPEPEGKWNAAEKAAGHGFAGDPLDNVGVQYGLNALKEGVITPAEFADINAKIGADNIEFKPTEERKAATEQDLERAYRSGAINEANNLTDVAIIDLRGPDYGTFHDAYRTWAIRERLEQAEGHIPKNDVLWFGETPLLGSPKYTTEGLLAMNEWLDAVEADHRALSLEQKVSEDRPADVHDRCQVEEVEGVKEVEETSVPGIGPVCQQPLVQSRFATPRMVAGEGVATDQEKCQLKPLARSRILPRHVHRRRVGAAREGVPDRRVRLLKAGRQAAGHDPVADLPERSRWRGCHLRRQGARPRASRLRRRLDERIVRRMAQVGRAPGKSWDATRYPPRPAGGSISSTTSAACETMARWLDATTFGSSIIATPVVGDWEHRSSRAQRDLA